MEEGYRGRESTVLLGEGGQSASAELEGGRMKTLSENETQVETRYAGMEI